MRSRIWLLLLVICAFTVTGYSQADKEATTVTPATTPTAAAVQTDSEKPASDKVTVYVYRYKQFTGSALEPAVYCDEKKIAAMDNGRYFKVILEPGKHTFQSNDKQSGVEIDLKNGEEYYIRVDIATGFWKGHGRLTMIQKEQGSFEIKKLKPIGKEKIVDHNLAFTEEAVVKG
jgi:hypothetical protein